MPSYGPVQPHQNPFKSQRKFTTRHLDDSDRAILAVLEEEPFSSVRELARATHLPPTPISRRLVNSHAFVLGYLRWVTHRLSDAHEPQHVELSSSLL
jgi:hypothetical protein